ncbi:MAG: Phosphoenolpyruvate carboxykinase (ATP) [Gammaproteobacteria bacterium]|nr:Phosphoenolpyruvate carboxykinase (ATP) [Gammaproteobacteria bacterium]
MEIKSLERDGNVLVIKGKVFGTMPMTARLAPAEARKGLRLLNFKMLWFLLTFLFRD